MAITTSTLSRAAGIAAALAGLIFIGVQIGHPHVDVNSVTTTEVIVRNSLKALMAVLALVGITGMYLRQVKKTGVLGLIGYVVYAAGYLVIMSTSFVGAYVIPSIAETDPSYVNGFIAASTRGAATEGVVTGDIGLLQTAIGVQGIGYLVGGLAFGIALYRARVLTRWAAALLAASGLVSAALAVMPDAMYRLLAYPNGIAMIALGYSLWRVAGTDAPARPAAAHSPSATTAGAR